MNSQDIWKSICADVFRIKMGRKKMELYVSKVEECAARSIRSLHPHTIDQCNLLKHKHLPHISSCEIWLCNYIVKIKRQYETNQNMHHYTQAQEWIREYVDTCLNNSYFELECDY